MQTEIRIIPVEGTKRALVEGVPAVGETVRCVLVGLAEEVDALRVRFRVGPVDAAVFPRPDTEDAWETDGEDAVCDLVLATRELRLLTPPGTRSLAVMAVVDNGEDAMLCEAPLRLLVWRKGIGPAPDPWDPAADWRSRCDEISDGLDAEAEHRVAGDKALDERLDAVEEALPNKADLENGKVPASQIPSVPPASHASTHAAGGSDAVTPSSIGAAAATHMHTKSQISDFPDIPAPSSASPAMDGAASPGSSAAFARGDHRHPVDTSRASVADATLNGRGLGDWTFSPSSLEGGVFSLELYSDEQIGDNWFLKWTNAGEGYEEIVGYTMDGADATSLSIELGNYMGLPPPLEGHYGETVTAVKSALPGYVLGAQADKPLAGVADLPAVVAPSTAASASGKAADAKATGDALVGKLDTSGGSMTGALSVYDMVTFTNGGLLAGTFSVSNTNIADKSDITVKAVKVNGTALTPDTQGAVDVTVPAVSAETWTFTLEDGTTLTKSVAVY